jgi:penicillin-binding protein 1C
MSAMRAVRMIRWSRVALALAASGGAILLAVVFAPLDPIDARMPTAGNEIVDASGSVLHRDIRDGLTLPVPADGIPRVVADATVAAEDQRFHWHPGVDPLAILRAAVNWRDAPSGASTIPQQLAHRLYLQDEGSRWVRKVREAWIALQLGARYSKEELLTAYLNNVYYGRGAYGIEAAARTYYGVPARDLDLAQASMLAGLPQAPGANDPIEHPEAARSRQRYVLDRMVSTGRLTSDAADAAARQALNYQEALPEPRAPHFAQYVRDELVRVRPDLADARGLRIETTLEGGVQADAERIVRGHLATMAARQAGDAAVVVIDPHSGGVIAMVGSPDYWRPEWGAVNLALRPRQPGSALKPFVYTAALEQGYTAASPLLDVPTTFTTSAGLYEPLDNDLMFRGPVAMRLALASSLNIPAVRMLAQVGTPAFLDIAQRVNLRSLPASHESAGLGLALGTAEVALLDLTAAYQVFADGGRWREPHAIARVVDARGRVLYERPASAPRQAISPEHAFIISDILSDAEARHVGFGGYVPEFETSMYSGVKTGSTTGGRDVWAVGFSTSRVVGTWVGNADGTSMIGVSSVSGAAPIWQAVMEASMRGLPDARPLPPPGVEAHTVCGGTGLLPGTYCPHPTTEYFVRGTAPETTETRYVGSSVPGVLLQDLPAEARGWAAAVGIAAPARSAPAVAIVEPPDGVVMYVAPELTRQQILLRAVVPWGASSVEFRLNGRLVGTADARTPEVVIDLTLGQHDLEVVAQSPAGPVTARSTFRVATP